TGASAGDMGSTLGEGVIDENHERVEHQRVDRGRNRGGSGGTFFNGVRGAGSGRRTGQSSLRGCQQLQGQERLSVREELLQRAELLQGPGLQGVDATGL